MTRLQNARAPQHYPALPRVLKSDTKLMLDCKLAPLQLNLQVFRSALNLVGLSAVDRIKITRLLAGSPAPLQRQEEGVADDVRCRQLLASPPYVGVAEGAAEHGHLQRWQHHRAALDGDTRVRRLCDG